MKVLVKLFQKLAGFGAEPYKKSSRRKFLVLPFFGGSKPPPYGVIANLCVILSGAKAKSKFA